MLADAADEISSHLHFYESEAFGASRVGEEISKTLRHCARLFVHQNAHELGFTKIIVDRLRKSHVIKLNDGVHVLGGLCHARMQEVLARSYAEMQEWVRLML